MSHTQAERKNLHPSTFLSPPASSQTARVLPSAALSRSLSSSQDYKRNRFVSSRVPQTNDLLSVADKAAAFNVSKHINSLANCTNSPSAKDANSGAGSLPNWPRSASHWLSASGRFGPMSIYSMLNSSFGNLSLTAFTYKPDFDQFHLLKVTPIDFANQISLIDVQLFLNIKQEEILSFGWNTPRKAILAPNITAYNRRFNQICFWTINEILLSNIKHVSLAIKGNSNGNHVLNESESIKCRAEVLSHFIRIAKKLYLLNNIQSCYAITSALHSSSIYRLTKTWNQISKKDKKSFEELSRLFSEENNFENLRQHMKTIKGSCIPYLGMYFKDLIYIDTAHPKDKKNNTVNFQRDLKIRETVQQIMDSYMSNSFENIVPIPAIRTYLQSINYIEELQKFMEEDYYKLSLKLEPPESKLSKSAKTIYDNKSHTNQSTFYISPSNNVSEESLDAVTCVNDPKNKCQRINVSNVTDANLVQNSLSSTSSKQFMPTHRKSLSLGANSSVLANRMLTNDSFRKPDNKLDNRPDSKPNRRYIVDDSLVEEEFDCGNQLCATNAEINKITCESLSTCTDLYTDSGSTAPDEDSISTAAISVCDVHTYQDSQLPLDSFDSTCSDSMHYNTCPSHRAHANCHRYDHPQADKSVEQVADGAALKASDIELQFECSVPRNNFIVNILYQGFVRRKTLLKDGKRPTLGTWVRYWLVLNPSSLIFYSSKSLRGCYRSHFKSQPSKCHSLRSTMLSVAMDDQCLHMDVFVLSDPSSNSMYKFKTNTQLEAITWCREIGNVLLKNAKISDPS